MQSNRAPRGIGVPLSIYNGYGTGWQYFLSSRTWKHPNPGYPLTLIILAIGGGGGGGNTGTSAINGESGGGGGSGRVSLTEQIVSTDQDIVIGTAGAGGTAGAAANTGSAGGTTTFGSLVSLAGGSGGAGTNSTSGGAGGSGGFGGGGGVGRPDTNSVAGAGGAGLDYIGGGPGAPGNSGGTFGTFAAVGSSAASAIFAPQPLIPPTTNITGGVTSSPGGWPNGAGIINGSNKTTCPPTGGDATLLFPMLMGRGAGGPAVNSVGAGVNGKAGAVLIMVMPF